MDANCSFFWTSSAARLAQASILTPSSGSSGNLFIEETWYLLSTVAEPFEGAEDWLLPEPGVLGVGWA
ncbi:hypothetical protein A33O_04408 [Nitratireductor aquibiodomus RA22]|uniref:Uncharacterized protein n=1 Tax=Nitratireductor aquibiodomus RA22 TaxID=1189611 RepID=I5C4S1_9HYPH|nr:hypothetical protein [Nitratireductor aquibiodomus]EIM76823.1 hypothetical protein A33O_04408 [Nitratireductor aquibiodomus RA22]